MTALQHALETEKTFQNEIAEIISESKYIKGQITDLDFTQTYPIQLIKTKYENFIKTDFESKDVETSIFYEIGAIYHYECENVPHKKYYIRFLGLPYGVSITQKEYDYLVNKIKSYYYD